LGEPKSTYGLRVPEPASRRSLFFNHILGESMKIASVILAAGKGVRMNSTLPKVLHPLLGLPMVSYAIAAAQEVTQSEPILVVGHGEDDIRRTIDSGVQFVVQQPQLGTGHAVLQAESLLRGQADLVLVTYADMPLLTADTLALLVRTQKENSSALTMLTMVSEQPRGFGRVLRDDSGDVCAVVEEAQATPEQLAVRELNVGVYCFKADWLWDALHEVELSPKGEYYLTDLVGIAVHSGLKVRTSSIDDLNETIGINTRVHLAEASEALRARINRHWMEYGVTLVNPGSTYIEPTVRIGRDTIIWPDTYLQGDTEIGEACNIGPNTILRNMKVGNACKILFAIGESALLEDGVEVGPFARLRKGAHLAQGVHMGNFGEVKNSYLGPGSKMGHFSYLGDATLGSNVNIGAGTITCNYDGEHKYPTEIGAGAFIGSDTMLVAPVKIGEKARTGAGSVVTKDVPPESLAVGVPARVIRKLAKRD
jgi:bifunctional UDP-N-acetylglucosamine pyrophosphorylase/glucosamine-1-phosphate N-acetyltransferase